MPPVLVPAEALLLAPSCTIIFAATEIRGGFA
jgi:hypothetical protein